MILRFLTRFWKHPVYKDVHGADKFLRKTQKGANSAIFVKRGYLDELQGKSKSAQTGAYLLYVTVCGGWLDTANRQIAPFRP